MITSSSEYRASARKISIYDSLAAEKRPFEPLDPRAVAPEVKMYVCGLTPQDHSHIGHGLVAARFDIVRRYMLYRRLQVNFVQNVTDVDDKIIEKELTTGEDPLAMTRRFTDEFYRCVGALQVLPVERLTRVTEFIPQIVSFIESLIEKGFAYVTPDGSVYFEVARKDDYGKLSKQNTSMLFESVRKELDKQKRSPLDFALWKRDERSSMSRPSPWGVGRPGWHIECSVMIHETLGDHIDIHGGGVDLKFPHHENEIAQSEAYSGGIFARFWMHGGLLNINGQKMSKSLNNFIRLVDGVDLFGSAPFRFVVARHHYRSAIDLSDKLFRDNLNALLDFHRLFAQLHDQASAVVGPEGALEDLYREAGAAGAVVSEAFEAAMDNDFNSPEALVALEQERARILAELERGAAVTAELAARVRLLQELGHVLGLFYEELEEVERQGLVIAARVAGGAVLSPSEVRAHLAARADARAAKDFARSDQIRVQLAAHGVEVLDRKGSVTWRFA
jgi:cysteinyl-tRNA synthetase